VIPGIEICDFGDYVAASSDSPFSPTSVKSPCGSTAKSWPRAHAMKSELHIHEKGDKLNDLLLRCYKKFRHTRERTRYFRGWKQKEPCRNKRHI
jgi:hypothetical protein